jgi:predicted pyridoxine 5'-phosphate oxidase superfamily flavin-nucleotide-binding protein
MGVLTADMRRVIEEQQLGFIATVTPDGKPNLSPKGSTKIYDDNHLIFADICSPNTVANLRANPAIEINVVDPILRKGWRFRGTAEVFGAGPRFEDLLAFLRRTGTTNPVQHVVLMAVERADELLSPAYDQGKTEAEIAAQWEAKHDDIRRRREARPAF